MKICYLFVCVFSSHSHGDVTITGEGLQILTNAQHSWLLGIEDSLACTPTMKCNSAYNDHFRGPVRVTPMQWSYHRLLLRLEFCCGWNSNTQPSVDALTNRAIAVAKICYM